MDTEQTKQQKHDSGSSLMTDIFVIIVNKSTKRPKLTVNVSQPAPTLRVCRRRYRKHYLLIEGQSQGESDELGDGVLGCGRVQDQAHLPAPEDTT